MTRPKGYISPRGFITKDGDRYIDLTGEKYDMLTAIKLSYFNKHHQSVWLCRCDCGKEREVMSGNLKNGHTRHCGCQKNAQFKHGCPSEYKIYHGMLQRCYNPRSFRWKDYGGRGIDICDRWLESYANFLADMGQRPSRNHSIERVNNNLGYSPENCRWATAYAQTRNTRRNHVVAVDESKLCFVDACLKKGITVACVKARMRRGLSFKQAISYLMNSKFTKRKDLIKCAL